MIPYKIETICGQTNICGAMICDCYRIGTCILLPWRGISACVVGVGLMDKLQTVSDTEPAEIKQLPADAVGCFFQICANNVVTYGGIVTVKDEKFIYQRMRIGY